MAAKWRILERRNNEIREMFGLNCITRYLPLAHISDRDQAIHGAIYERGLSLEAAGREFGVGVETVRVNIFRTNRKIQKYLRQGALHAEASRIGYHQAIGK